MGFARGEFLRALPAAVAPFCVERKSDSVYVLRHGGERVALTLRAESARALGALTLPVTVVRLEFFGFSRARYAEFFGRYQRRMQKGGG